MSFSCGALHSRRDTCPRMRARSVVGPKLRRWRLTSASTPKVGQALPTLGCTKPTPSLWNPNSSQRVTVLQHIQWFPPKTIQPGTQVVCTSCGIDVSRGLVEVPDGGKKKCQPWPERQSEGRSQEFALGANSFRIYQIFISF